MQGLTSAQREICLEQERIRQIGPLKMQELQFNMPPAKVTYSVSRDFNECADMTCVCMVLYLDGGDVKDRVFGLLFTQGGPGQQDCAIRG